MEFKSMRTVDWWLLAKVRGRQSWTATLELLFPPQCAWCGQALKSGRNWNLCRACRAGLKRGIEAWCPRCASPLRLGRPRAPAISPLAGEGETASRFDGAPIPCSSCAKEKPPFQGAVAAGIYRGPLRQSVIQAKQSHHAAIANILGRLIADAVLSRRDWQRPDVITFIPSHWLKRARRGHCSAEVMAGAIGKRLHRPVRALLHCDRRTAKQGVLGRRERRRNVRGAFSAVPGYDGTDQHVLLVDDVMTTASTASAATRALIQAGVAEVHLAVAARGTGNPWA